MSNVKFQTKHKAADTNAAITLGVRMVDASIVVTTYNHGPYIAHCLASILEQTTKRNIEIVWYDDASTDDTIAIGEEILKHCPHNVVRIHHSNNRHQRGIPILLDKIERCNGKYLFWAEGDDCWLDQNKVDLQIDALEQNPDIKLCFTPAFVFSGNNNKPLGVIARHSEHEKIFTLEEVITGDGGFMPTISLCFRREIFNTAPDWLFEYLSVTDYPMQVIASSPSGALYLPTITCAYRQHVEGSWTTTVFNNSNKRIEFEAEFIKILAKLKRDFPGNNEAFSKIIYSHGVALLKMSIEQGNFSALQEATHALGKL